MTTSHIGKRLSVVTNLISQMFTIKVDGVLRGETKEFNGQTWSLAAESAGGIICSVQESIGGDVRLRDESPNEDDEDFDGAIACRKISLVLKNPKLFFSSIDGSHTQSYVDADFELGQITSSHNDSFYLKELYATSCNELVKSIDQRSFVELKSSMGPVCRATHATAKKCNDDEKCDWDDARRLCGGRKPEFYAWDQRLRSVGNTVMEPAEVEDWAGGKCPMASKSFLNAHGCRRQKTDACAPQVYTGAVTVPLSETMMKLWYNFNSLYVYRVEGLRLEDIWEDHTPCNDGVTSRWIRRKESRCAGEEEAKLDKDTKTTIETAFRESIDDHPTIKDLIVTAKGGTCDQNSTKGAKVTINRNECWEHVHPHEYNVYDFTKFTLSHRGTPEAIKAGRPDPIAAFANSNTPEDEHFDLIFPPWHTMDRWVSYGTRGGHITLMGKHMEYVSFANLHTAVQTEEIATYINATTVAIDGGLFEACGSPGEVQNEVRLGNRYYDHCTIQGGCSDFAQWAIEPDWNHDRTDGKSMVWQNMAFKADDQLRHRIAWALSQIFVVAEGSLEGQKFMTEPYAAYYDIFVKHAFGSYRDIMREVAASPFMGLYLTYKGNKEAEGGKLPDENFAREIMQLFTIGLFELEVDGTIKEDGVGGGDTYTNDDIATFARAWTGFDYRASRGNYENGGTNYFDPMQLKTGLRDQFPKTKLRSGYLGDGFPLCSDLPATHFLLKGTIYQYTGNVSTFGKTFDEPEKYKDRSNLHAHFTPEPGVSALHATLCRPQNGGGGGGGGVCTFPVEVILDENIECSDEIECSADDVKIVKIVSDNGEVGFYNHIPARCTRLAFFENGMKTAAQGQNPAHVQCVDPLLPGTTGTACCNVTSGDFMYPEHLFTTSTATTTTGTGTTTLTSITTSVDPNSTTTTASSTTTQTTTTQFKDQTDAQCFFVAETMKYETAQKRCAAAFGPGVDVCERPGPAVRGMPPISAAGCATGQHTWMRASCHLQVEVHPSGDVSILEPYAGMENRRLAQATGAKFRVRWNTKPGQTTSDVIFPLVDQGCDDGCHAVAHSCVCDITVDTRTLYRLGSKNDALPSEADMLKLLTIGAYSPAEYGAGVYLLCREPQCTSNPAVSVWTKGGGTVINTDTIFEFKNRKVALSGGGRFQKYWMNRISDVRIGRDYNPLVDTYEKASGVGQAGGICTCPSGEEYEVGEIGVGCEQLACIGGVAGSCNATGIASENWHKKVVCAGSTEATTSKKGFSFRNPPGFNPFIGKLVHKSGPYRAPSTWDVPHGEHETDALLDHLFEHENTPPFVALHMIKRFVTSNPSPRYVESVATAFITGSFNGTTYSGKRGDMKAAMAALLLDREARASILDADPTHGKFQEPLLKVIKMMRALDYTSVDDREILLHNTQGRLGQNAFRSPSVFNYYLAEYSPPGSLGDLALVAPESQIMTAPTTISYLNAMTHMIQHGHIYPGGFSTPSRRKLEGAFKFKPTNPHDPVAVIDELSILLTEGRLDDHNRKVIVEEYANFPEDIHSVYSTGTNAYYGKKGDTLEADSLKPDDDESRIAVNVNQSSTNATNMSSVQYGWPVEAGAASALAYEDTDGDISGHRSKVGKCAVTNFEANPWWEVDLGAVTEVRSLVIVTSSIAKESFSDFDVFLDGVKCNSSANTSMINTGYHHISTWDRMARTRCVGAGQVVRIQLNTVSSDPQQLVLCMVQVEKALKTNAFKHAQKLFLATSELHATNLNRAKPSIKPEPAQQVAYGRPYKAMVILFLNGGCDSYSLIVPHSKCKDIVDPASESGEKMKFDLYEEYANVRGVAALPKADLLPIDVPKENKQPCDTFGVHPSLPFIHELYQNGSATFFANLGTMVEPITKEEFTARGGATKKTPTALFSHNGQQKVTMTVDSANMAAHGILGRLAKDVTEQEKPYKSALYSMAGTSKILQGSGAIVSPDIVGSNGIARFKDYEAVKEGFDKILKQDSASLFSQTFSDSMQSTLDKTEFMGELIANVTATSNYTVDPEYSMSKQFDLVAKMIKLDTTELQNERAAYVVQKGGFDTHFTPDLSPHFTDINFGLEQFVNELKAQGLWENVTIMCISDFGRTITSNSQGTDHSWAGNYWMLGGDVNGGQILGKYPQRLDKEYSDEVERSRVIPTTPWEAVWKGIAEWWGVANETIPSILPNAANFPEETLFSRSTLFKS